MEREWQRGGGNREWWRGEGGIVVERKGERCSGEGEGRN